MSAATASDSSSPCRRLQQRLRRADPAAGACSLETNRSPVSVPSDAHGTDVREPLHKLEHTMKLTDLFLAELDREAPRTRRTLEHVPLDRDDWKPHPKSMPLGRLAGLVASMPSWVTLVIEQDELDLTPPPGQGQYQQPPTDKLVETLDKHVTKARESLSKTNDDFLMTTQWRLLAGGQVVMEA